MVPATSPERQFFFAEVLKFLVSVVCVFAFDCKGSFRKFGETVGVDMMLATDDWLKLMVPSILYTVQNSLQYYSMSVLSAPVFQVLYQMKIITTALFSVLILNKRLLNAQWVSILCLAVGVALVQLSQLNPSSDGNKTNGALGLLSVVCSCVTSGFAGVYFELVLKGSSSSLWFKNVQLSFIGMVVGLASCYLNSSSRIASEGFLIGYNKFVIIVILLQALGGLIVAIVVKYADNVLKGFATSLSIILSALFSFQYFHDVDLNAGFVVGAGIVLTSVYLYGRGSTPHPKLTPSDNLPILQNGQNNSDLSLGTPARRIKM